MNKHKMNESVGTNGRGVDIIILSPESHDPPVVKG